MCSLKLFLAMRKACLSSELIPVDQASLVDL